MEQAVEAAPLRAEAADHPVDLSRVACAAIAAAGGLFRVAVALRPLDIPDRFFIPDDTFYTLNIARHLAHGLGPTADGVRLTNGFQPLLAFLLTPVFWFTSDPDAALRVDLLLLAVADGVLAFALGELARRAAPKRAELSAVLATALWSASPLAITYALGGLETTLGLLAVTALAISWISAAEEGEPRAYYLPGVLAGVALLARIDTAFMVGGLGLILVYRRQWRELAVVVVGALCAIGPWWVYELARFGTIIPVSGLSVRQQVVAEMIHGDWLLPERQVALSLGAVLEALTGRQFDFRLLLYDGVEVGRLLTPLAGAGLIAAAHRWTRASSAGLVTTVLAASAVALWSFYALYLAATWFFPRYLAPVHLAMVVVLAAGGPLLIDHPRRRASMVVAGLSIALLLIWPAVHSYHYLVDVPDDSIDDVLHGGKAYRLPIHQVLAAAPPDAIIGSMQSGALGYYGETLRPDLTIFNLDGVVDGEAAVAFGESRLDELARARGMTYMAGWGCNINTFVEQCHDGRMKPESFEEVMRGSSQGGSYYRLLRMHWPGSTTDPH